MLPQGRSPGAEARNYRARRQPPAGAGAREARTMETPRPKRRQQKGQRGCQRTTDNRPTGERRQGRERPTACQRRTERSRPDRSQTRRANCAQGALPAPGGPPLSRNSGPQTAEPAATQELQGPGKPQRETAPRLPLQSGRTHQRTVSEARGASQSQDAERLFRADAEGKSETAYAQSVLALSHDSHEHPKA